MALSYTTYCICNVSALVVCTWGISHSSLCWDALGLFPCHSQENLSVIGGNCRKGIGGLSALDWHSLHPSCWVVRFHSKLERSPDSNQAWEKLVWVYSSFKPRWEVLLCRREGGKSRAPGKNPRRHTHMNMYGSDSKHVSNLLEVLMTNWSMHIKCFQDN